MLLQAIKNGLQSSEWSFFVPTKLAETYVLSWLAKSQPATYERNGHMTDTKRFQMTWFNSYRRDSCRKAAKADEAEPIEPKHGRFIYVFTKPAQTKLSRPGKNWPSKQAEAPTRKKLSALRPRQADKNGASQIKFMQTWEKIDILSTSNLTVHSSLNIDSLIFFSNQDSIS